MLFPLDWQMGINLTIYSILLFATDLPLFYLETTMLFPLDWQMGINLTIYSNLLFTKDFSLFYLEIRSVI